PVSRGRWLVPALLVLLVFLAAAAGARLWARRDPTAAAAAATLSPTGRRWLVGAGCTGAGGAGGAAVSGPRAAAPPEAPAAPGAARAVRADGRHPVRPTVRGGPGRRDSGRGLLRPRSVGVLGHGVPLDQWVGPARDPAARPTPEGAARVPDSARTARASPRD